LELTERDVGRDPERDGLREAITVPASRARQKTTPTVRPAGSVT
jgi:hypothetical protein